MNKLNLSILMTMLVLPLAVAAEPKGMTDRLSTQMLLEKQKNKAVIQQYYQDIDADRVLTRLDQCPNSEVGVPVNIYGCQLDSDGDGIYDHHDACPDTPAGRRVNFLGCQTDTDGDGVLDFYDLCPDTPLGTPVDETGCPLPIPPEPVVEPRSFVISHIVFDTGSYAISDGQRPILDRDAAQLQQLTEADLLLVTGFTDDVGSPESNVQLSWNRAQSVKDYLVRYFNLPAEQIYVLGLGESLPIAGNDTAQGRQLNRRIEFQVLMDGEQPPEAAALSLPDEMRGYQRFPSRIFRMR